MRTIAFRARRCPRIPTVASVPPTLLLQAAALHRGKPRATMNLDLRKVRRFRLPERTADGDNSSTKRTTPDVKPRVAYSVPPVEPTIVGDPRAEQGRVRPDLGTAADASAHAGIDFGDHPPPPVRGSLEILASAASPQIVAGSAFSIFVKVQNPFDVPIRLFQVETHIPVDLRDVSPIKDAVQQSQAGIAYAQITGPVQSGYVSLVGYDEESGKPYDAGYYRDYVDLQPGDSNMQQFVLQTRHMLLFQPLTHSFHFQVVYSEQVKRQPETLHTRTLPFQLSIRANLFAIIAGGLAGAIVGVLLKVLTTPASTTAATTLAGIPAFLQALFIALLATLAVVIGFARKTSAQPFVSIEDFWGGSLIGFSVGFLGYEQFSSLFSPETAS